ncbi:Mitochondrial import inner membrane translocase subunit tim22 [Savitreella phatthalungensis]
MSSPFGNVTLPGSAPARGNGAGAMSQQEQQAYVMQSINAVSESCAFKTVLSGGAGFGLGALFGLFMSSMQIENTDNALYDKPFKEQMRIGFRDMGKKSYSTAKNFAVVGAIFAGSECCIEGYRAKNDLYNSATAGCFTGAVLARNAGPQAMALGCGGFAAFSTAIDAYMKSG